MDAMFEAIAELHKQAKALKSAIRLASDKGGRLREALYNLEAAIHKIERHAADAYKGSSALNHEQSGSRESQNAQS